MKKTLFALLLIVMLTATACQPSSSTSTPPPPIEQFHWKGVMEIPTVTLLDNEAPNIYHLQEQIPMECQEDCVYYRDDLNYSGYWYSSNDLFVMNTRVISAPGVETYITPILFNNKVEPHVVVSTEHPELRQAAIDNMLENKHWGIIIQLDLPPTEELTGQLPLYTEVPVECWAGSYGGGGN